MSETGHLEIGRSKESVIFKKIDQLLGDYVRENNHPLQGWGHAEPKPALKNPERLRAILRDYGRHLISRGQNPEELIHAGLMADLAALETVFQGDYEVIGGVNPELNCAMYALDQLGIKSDLRSASSKEEVLAVINDNFDKLVTEEHAAQLPLEAGELVLIEDGGEDGWHVAVVEKVGEQLVFRSKLGSLFVVRNESIDDLVRLYRGQSLTLYRKR